MKRININFKLALVTIIIIQLLSCSRYTHKRKYNKINKKASSLRLDFGTINAKIDTCVIMNNKQFCYSNGLLVKTGRLKNNAPFGEWYIFTDSLRLQYILKYNKSNEIDTILRPFILINPSF